MDHSNIEPEDSEGTPIFDQPETTNHETDSDFEHSQQSDTDEVSIEQFKTTLDKGRRDRDAQREWLEGRDLESCRRCRSAGVECTTNSDVGAKCERCRVQGSCRSLQCSQFDEYLIDYVVKFLGLSDSTARDLFRDYGTKGSKHRGLKKTSMVENQSDRESYKTKEEVEAMVKETVELRVQVETLEQQLQDSQAQLVLFKKCFLDIQEECENLEAKEEKTNRLRQRYKEDNLELLAANANLTTKQNELETELGRMRVDHRRYIEEKEEENRMLVEQREAAKHDVGKYSAKAERQEKELVALRKENEHLQKKIENVPELENKLDEFRQRLSDEKCDMVRFQLRVDQVVAILQCTLTPEELEKVKDGRIVKTSLEELKKVTQECVMSRVSRGDDVFEVGRTLLTLISNGKHLEAESTNKRGLDSAKPFNSAQGNKRQRLTED